MSVHIISAATWGMYTKWLEVIMSEPDLTRFNAPDGYADVLGAAPDSEWSKVTLVDSDCLSCATIHHKRGAGRAMVSLFVSNKNNDRATRAAAMIRAIVSVAAGSPVDWIDSVHAETNEPAKELHERTFGAAWGTKPGAYWDRQKRQWVGSVAYAARLDDLLAKFGHDHPMGDIPVKK